MDPYAELADLTARFPRDLTSAEADRAPTLLGDASFWLGVWVPGLAEAVASDEQVAEAAKLLVVAMVKRALLAQIPDNPGVQSITQGAGPYNQSVTYRNPEGNLYLYAGELDSITRLLRPSAVSLRSPGL
ncbi:Gp19/Gp15/Gp42 family protein [Mycobacterium sp. 23]|uniref:Gp19/Gp15/Gp42 family protein n=1 Tax=Mycobacterium sp. 23 TaxID=3400424 RepID=UPI003AAF9A8B